MARTRFPSVLSCVLSADPERVAKFIVQALSESYSVEHQYLSDAKFPTVVRFW